MRLSKLFTTTTREAPAEAELRSHQLLVRAAYIKQQSSGVFSILPLGLRSLRRIEGIIREEMDRIGGQEILMPVVVTADLWRESGRWHDVAEELLRFQDRNDKDMVLAMTHEEVVTDIARRFLSSYRQLPVMIYQIQTKYRDEARPRGGLIRLREFTMKDAYSFHTTAEDLDEYYEDVYQAYLNIYHRSGLPVAVVQSDPGMMGGKIAHEFMLVTPGGEDTLVLCSDCDYAANLEVAASARRAEPFEPLPLESVPTPGCTTIEQVSSFLGVRPRDIAKCVAYRSDDDLYLVLVRGDLEVNPVRLQNHVQRELVPATDDDLTAGGLIPGYMSPVGAGDNPGLRILVDPSVTATPNLVAGANRDGYHLQNVCFGRDFSGDVVDVATVMDGDTCTVCGGTLKTARAIEVGNIFKLGTKYSESMSALFTDETGRQRPMVMGCYGIGTARILASAVELLGDKDGMCLPVTIAPFEVHLVAIDYHKQEQVREAADRAYDGMRAAGLSVLLDDRKESPGVKFKDADLIGIPLRVTVSPRTLGDDECELKLRSESDQRRVAIEQMVSEVQTVVAGLYRELELPANCSVHPE